MCTARGRHTHEKITVILYHFILSIILAYSYIPLGTLYPFTTTSSDDSFAIIGTTGYILIASLIHIVV